MALARWLSEARGMSHPSPLLLAKPRLFIGNLNYSSWSLRPWLCLRWAGIELDETVIDLDQPGYGEGKIAEVLAVSPTGKVPALQVGDHAIWDSLAIAEWAAEVNPQLWPEDPWRRAVARSVTCEMHSGFAAVRRDLSMNLRRRVKATGLGPDVVAEIARIDQLWATTRARFGGSGDHLFGRRSIADAFFTPVATRFRTYGVDLSAAAQRYADTLLQDPAFLDWEARVLAAEPVRFSRSNVDDLFAP